MKKYFVILHTDSNKKEFRKILTIAPTYQAAKQYFEEYKREKSIAVQKEWQQSPQSIIDDYLPNFIEDAPGHFTSSQTWETIEIEKHNMLNYI